MPEWVIKSRDKKPALHKWLKEMVEKHFHDVTIKLIENGFQYSDIQYFTEIMEDALWDMVNRIEDQIDGNTGEIRYVPLLNAYYEEVGRPKVKKKKPKPRKYDMYFWDED